MSDETPVPAAIQFAAALQELHETYPTDPDDAATVLVTITGPDGTPYQAKLQPGQASWLTTLVMDEMATCRNAHSDGTNQCAHCAGRGTVRTIETEGGAA